MVVIYVITNGITGKSYVGQTRQPLQRRWRGHIQLARKGVRTVLYAAIRKYGELAFTIAPIATCLSDPGIVEAEFIKVRGTKVPTGYNLTDGGDGVVGLPREIIERTAALNRGRKHTAEAKRLIGIAGIGRKKTAAGCAAISAARKGKPLSVEHRQKLAAAKLGKKLAPRSPEHSARISAGLVRAHARRREAATCA
jgi:group I intron endonuclease